MDLFVAEGMRRYKRASATLVSFGKAVESRLQAMLVRRKPKDWAPFAPERGNRAKSTKYWSEYPLFNAKIDGHLDASALRISIDVNWFDSDGDYPFYAVRFEPAEPLREEVLAHPWEHRIRALEDGSGVRFDPSPDDFDLERDFGVLLDEVIGFLGARGHP
jgi:hypothetical protein